MIMAGTKDRDSSQDPDKIATVASTRINEKGEVALVVRPSNPRRGGRSKHPRKKEEIREILRAHGQLS
jgi:hypothetical protein